MLLLIASSGLCLIGVEVYLRVFHPEYQYAAESSFDTSGDRIWLRVAGKSYERVHPDTGRPHIVHHNNLALRHYRDIAEEGLERPGVVNIGFFGDSFTENIRMSGEYAFTEVLDFLLNERGRRFNVLNFGVDGYGTDQSYRAFEAFEHAGELDHVFYMFFLNDIRNIYENGLFTLDPERGVVATSPPPVPWWTRWASRLYTTYLLAQAHKLVRGDAGAEWSELAARERNEARQRESSKRRHDERAESLQGALSQGETSDDVDAAVSIFHFLLDSWKESVESRGGEFHVVLLPLPTEHRARHLIPRGFDVIDLYAAFAGMIPDYDYEAWRFENDPHWNEAGNQLAAVALYRALEDRLGLPALGEDALKAQLSSYYSSFDAWKPDPSWLRPAAVDGERRRAIRERYGPEAVQN